MKNKKAALSTETMIIAALALVVLVVLIISFSNGMNRSSEKKNDFENTLDKCESEFRTSKCFLNCGSKGLVETQGECPVGMECCV